VAIAAPVVIDSDTVVVKVEEGLGEIERVTERGVDEGEAVRERSRVRFCEV
jgi:hypothetical protein